MVFLRKGQRINGVSFPLIVWVKISFRSCLNFGFVEQGEVVIAVFEDGLNDVGLCHEVLPSDENFAVDFRFGFEITKLWTILGVSICAERMRRR